MSIKNPHGFDVRKANTDYRRDNNRRTVLIRKASDKKSNDNTYRGRCLTCRQKEAFCWCKSSTK